MLGLPGELSISYHYKQFFFFLIYASFMLSLKNRERIFFSILYNAVCRMIVSVSSWLSRLILTWSRGQRRDQEGETGSKE